MIDWPFCLDEPVVEQCLVEGYGPTVIECCRDACEPITGRPCFEPELRIGVKMLIRWPTDHNSAVPENSKLAWCLVIYRGQKVFNIVQRDCCSEIEVQGDNL